MDQIPVWLRTFATAKVGERPRSVSHHGYLSSIIEEVEQRDEGTTGQDVVAHFRTITSNVP